MYGYRFDLGAWQEERMLNYRKHAAEQGVFIDRTGSSHYFNLKLQ